MKRVIDSDNVTFTIVVNNTVRTNIVKRCKSDTCFVCGLSIYQPCGKCDDTYDYLEPFNRDKVMLIQPLKAYFSGIRPVTYDILQSVLPAEIIECILTHVSVVDIIPIKCAVTMDKNSRICHTHCEPNIWDEVKTDRIGASATISNIKGKKS